MAKTATSEELVLITPQQTKLITETIETKLAARNVTDQAIAKYTKEAKALKIEGPDDKAGYEAVYKKRQEGKKTRILASEICKAGREPLQAEVALWIEKETQIKVAIKEAESYLLGQEEEYEAAKQKIEDDKQAAIAERLKERDKILVGFGARCNGVDYYLDEVSFPLSLVKGSEDDFFYNQLAPNFEKIFWAKEEIRIANENALREQKEREEKERKEREEKEKKEREEFEKQQNELRDQQAKIKAHSDRIEREKERVIKEKIKERNLQLELIGFGYSMSAEKYVFHNLTIDPEALNNLNDEDWDQMVGDMLPKVDIERQHVENKKSAELRRLNQEAIDKANREREEKEEQERLQKEAELLEAKESVRYKAIVEYLKAVKIGSFDSGRYIKKVRIIKDFLADLK